jgi:hypothetical protein
LEERVIEKADNKNHHMHDCSYKSIHTKPGKSTLSPDCLFEAAVCKVQARLEQQLTEEEAVTLVLALKWEGSKL